jgi:uncharacterized membrane protein
MSDGLPAAMPFGVALNRIFALVKTHFRVLCSIAAVPMALIFLLYGLLVAALVAVTGHSASAAFAPDGLAHSSPLSAGQGLVLAAFWLVALVPTMGVYALHNAAMSFAAAQAELGQTPSFRRSWGFAWQRLGSYLWLMVLRSLMIAWPILATVALIALGAGLVALAARGDATSNLSTGLMFLIIPAGVAGYLAAMVYAVFMTLRYALAFPAAVAEGLTARDALKRSALLTAGSKGRIFLIMLVLYAVSYAAEMVLLLVFGLVFAVGAGLYAALGIDPAGGAGMAGISVLGLLLFAVILLWAAALVALYMTTFTVVYYDQVRRKDSVQARQVAPYAAPPIPPGGLA